MAGRGGRVLVILMFKATSEQLAQAILDLELAAPAEVEAGFREAGGRGVSVDALGDALVRRELITGYQLERLLRGERRGFFYGSSKILYQAGAGSFARVFRAVNRHTGAIIAVKVLRTRHIDDAERQQAFRREGEMGRLLRHPNIVAIEEVGEEHGVSYLTMEFIEGQTLRELVRIRGALDLPRALDLIQQMAAGLEYAHRRGVTHRDLKASNVLVSSAGRAKLVDFGLAGIDETGDSALGRLEQPRTIDYAALEKLTGMRDDSFRSDIFFFGMLAQLVLTGQPALAETRNRNLRSDPGRFTSMVPLATRAAHLPRDVIETVGRMTLLDPLERWQTVADVRRAVEQLVETHAAAAGPAAPAALGAAPTKGTLMLVEPDEVAQRAFREFFGGLGYRVLVTGNPRRALTMCEGVSRAADCLVLSSHTLGNEAIDAFNMLATDPAYAGFPAVLVAGETQAAVEGMAKCDALRRFTRLPIRKREFARLLQELVAARSRA